MKLLLLEDHPPDARFITELLKKTSPGTFTVQLRGRMDEALRALPQDLPDVALVDMGLPDSSGLDTLRTLLAAHPDLPVVLLTGLDDEVFAAEAVRAGAQDYLVKGHISGEALVRTLHYAVERVHAREELARSAAAQRILAETQVGILNALPAQVALLDNDGVILAVNEAWRRFASAQVLQSEDFYVGQNYIAVCEAAHGECSPEALEVARGIRQVLRGAENLFVLEYACHSPTEQRWFRLTVTPLNGSAGAGAVVMHENVTEHRMAEDDLREREIEQRRLAETLTAETQRLHESQAVANVGSWETNFATLETTWTDETYRIFEVSPAEFKPTHQRFLALVHPDDRARVDAAFLESLGRPEVFSIEHQICVPGGRTKFVEERWQSYAKGNGRPHRAVGTCQDITARKRADLALRTSEDRLRTIVETEPECVKIVAPDGRLLDINPAGLRMIEANAVEEVVGQALEKLVHPDDLQSFTLLHQQACLGETGRAQFRIIGLKGSERWLESHATPLRATDGSITSVLSVTRDFTERHQHEEQLRLLETCVARLNDIVLITDAVSLDEPGPRILYVNDAFVRRTGYTREEAIGRTPRMLQGPKTQRDALDRIRTALESRQPVREELINYTKSGEEFWLELEIVPVADSKGRVTHWVSIERDITERKKSEADLANSEARFRLMVEGSEQVLFYTHDREHRFTYLSPSTRDVLGYEPEELLGQKYHLLLFPDDAMNTAVDEVTDQAMNEGVPSDAYPVAVRHKDGRRLIMEILESPILQGGVVVGLQGFARDITERVQAQENVRESGERFRSLFDQAGVGMCLVSADGCFLRANRHLCAILGYPREELLSRKCVSTTHPEDRAREAESIERLLNGEFPAMAWEKRYLRKDGTSVWCNLTLSLMPAKDNGMREFIGVIHDISAQKLAEEKIRSQLQELERWRHVTLGREDRIQALKMEVNALLRDRAESTRYAAPGAPPPELSPHQRS